MSQTRRTMFAAVAGSAVGFIARKKPEPTDDEVEQVAREMFLVAHTAAKNADNEWRIIWDDIRSGYRAGWVAIAKWHLEKVQ